MMCCVLVILLSGTVLADAPAGYYDTVDYKDAATIRATLHDIIDGHTKIPYTASSTDTWNVLELADQDPNDPGRILDVYRNASYPKYGAGNNDYNREHTWPKSYGFPDDGSTNKPYSDCHMLFLCNDSYNSSRNNNIYDDCASNCTAYPTFENNGQVGTNYRSGSYSWETWSMRRGDVARAQLYADLRYEGDSGSEPDLILTDSTSLILVTGGNAAVAYMGKLSTLIKWHYEDPVDDRERNRNDVVYTYQGNRNPFIDHPEFVAYLFEGVVAPVDDVLPSTTLAGARIANIYPNPFNPATNIQFVLGQPGAVRVEVFAVDGRRVRTLLEDKREAGEFQVFWNGMSDDGLRAPSGTYFFRLISNGQHDTRPAVLLK
jgi:endonuclease I